MKNINNQRYVRLVIATLLVLCNNYTILSAQTLTNYIHFRNITESQLTQTQLSNLEKIQNNTSFLEHNFIQIEDLMSFQYGGQIKVNIPGGQCQNLIFKAKNVQYYSPNKYTWYGEVESPDTCSCFEGHLMVLAQDSIKFGNLKIDDNSYSIDDIGGGVNVLGKVVLSNSNEIGCRVLQENDEITFPEAQSRGGGNCDVRVLILFTPSAASFVTNITSTATTDLTLTNQAFRNSGLSQSDVNLVLAGVVGVTFTETPVIENDLIKFTSTSSTITSTTGVPLATLISNARADVVMILGRSTSWDLAGLQQGFGPFTTTSFAILQVGDGPAGYSVFAHELGHLFGCRHETCGNSNSGNNCDDNGLSEHAHVFKTGCWPNRKNRRTIMFSSVSDKVIPHFSNPQISYKGKPTGDGTHNNSAMLRSSACTMANAFIGGDPPITVHIIGDIDECSYASIVGFGASVSGGSPGPYSFEWRKSSDGVNYGGVIGTNSLLSIPSPFYLGEKLFVRVKVTSANNETSEDFFTTNIIHCEDDPHDRSVNLIDKGVVTVFPNPLSDQMKCSFTMDKSMNVTLKITDFSGNPIKTIFDNIWLEGGYYQEIVNLESIPQGIYNLYLLTGDKIINSRIIKL